MRIPGDCHKSSCAVSSEGLWGVWDQFCKFCPYLGSTVGNAVCLCGFCGIDGATCEVSWQAKLEGTTAAVTHRKHKLTRCCRN